MNRSDEKMKAARETGQTYWINLGKRMAAAGKSVEFAIKPLSDPIAIELVMEGHAKEMKRRARAASKGKVSV